MADLLVLLVRIQLNQDELENFFHSQNKLVLTSEDKEVSCTDIPLSELR